MTIHWAMLAPNDDGELEFSLSGELDNGQKVSVQLQLTEKRLEGNAICQEQITDQQKD